MEDQNFGTSFGTTLIDTTVRDEITDRKLHNFTVETLSDRKTPVKREIQAAIRTINNMPLGDILILVPKPPMGQTLDQAHYEEYLTPIIRELGNPIPLIDPRDTQSPEDLINIFQSPLY